jgi:alpha-galactosidase
VAYHWDFGDGITADGASLGHTFTLAGTYRVKLVADGLDGIPAEKIFSVVVDGLQEIGPARRYIEPGR